ncbi:MAG: hypothetical protein KQI78_25320 [Deltaproteobacteria bacterium]|nr:hypothetical protein [Deltaproteobacteria bacterium]
MSLPKNKVIISVQVDYNIRNLLKKYSKELDLPLSKFARNLIYIALDDFKILNKGGVIPLLKFFTDGVERHVKHEGIREALIALKDKKPVTISVVIDKDVKEQLDKYADYLGLPLNIFGRNLIYVGLDQFKILRMAGFVKLSKMASAFKLFVKALVDDNSANENHNLKT